MTSSRHRFARFVRLALACLALFGGVGAAQAGPVPDPVSLSVGSARPLRELARPFARVEARAPASGVSRPWVAVAAVTPLAPEFDPRGPPAPLFLLHRALLR